MSTLLLAGILLGAAPQPVELGRVAWLRNLATAQSHAQQTGRPLLILFDEVPGCSTVVGFGERVLSHPLIADAIEQEFTPLAVYNNTAGEDRAVLQQFKEPAWNNPVVRVLAAGSSAELVPRFDGPYQVGATANMLVAALTRAHRPVPGYLQLLAEEEAAPAQTALLSMYCFWEGETRLGATPGVVRTEAGFVSGREVVRVSYDPRRVSPSALKSKLGYNPVEGRFQPSAKDDKYQLKGTAYAYVPMTPMQRMRINAHADPDAVLSPSQKRLLTAVQARPNAGWSDVTGDTDLAAAFARVSR